MTGVDQPLSHEDDPAGRMWFDDIAGTVWDDVIVGAGAAGAVLASRLSEDPSRRVLLLEAGAEGPSTAADRPLGMPVLTGANWDYTAEVGDTPRAGSIGACRYPYPLGRTLGGSAAVNGAVALRGLPADFDGWAAAGNPEWAWRHVLPYYLRIEADRESTGDEHSTNGQVPIRRPTPDEVNAIASGFLLGCRRLGLPGVADMNDAPGAGVGLVPSNAVGHQVMSTALTHLEPARHRPNLNVLPDFQVTKVLVRGGRVTGVNAIHDGQLYRIDCGQVTLSAGAIGTPTILLRSGIGEARQLERLDIAVTADRAGVGRNLADHPAVAIWAQPQPDMCRAGEPWHQAMARLVGRDGADLNLFLANNVETGRLPIIGAMLGGRLAISVAAVLTLPRSRGQVTLRGAAPAVAPDITLRLASDPADLARLVEGVRLAWSVVRSGDLAPLLQRVFVWTDRMVADDNLARASIARLVAPMWHPVGTARMGPASDPLAVVDERCRVHDVSGLRVVDAAAMPAIPAAPPFLTCVMLAERVAEWMR